MPATDDLCCCGFYFVNAFHLSCVVREAKENRKFLQAQSIHLQSFHLLYFLSFPSMFFALLI